MKRVHVKTPEGYPVYIGLQLINKLPELLRRHDITNKRRLVCITDSNLEPLYLKKITKLLIRHHYKVETIIIPAGERSKNIATFEDIMGQCLQYEINRESVIVAIGGGVVGDLAGFVAATYMRGIRYVHIPTTIIAHDSSIGGKVGVNHKLGKNVIGAFHQPAFVLFDVLFLETLSIDERIAGYAEIIKHALIQDKSFMDWLKEHSGALVSLDLEKVEEAIFRSCKIKADIVSRDEREMGLRMILNYGHTIGHALETVTEYNRYKHGEAVSIGICAAAHISDMIYGNNITQDTIELVKSFGLPTRFIGSYSDGQLVSAMKCDKKRKEEKFTFVLSPELGKAEVVQIEEKPITKALRKIRLG